jgi:hypothetical protein
VGCGASPADRLRPAPRPGARQITVAYLLASALLVVVALSLLAEHVSVPAAVACTAASAVGLVLARRAWRSRA